MYIAQLVWNKCERDTWCPLLTLNLSHPVFDGLVGIYIIWHGGPNASTVRVGQGEIADRLKAHRLDPQILAYSPHGLFVTWAKVDRSQLNGIERYLGDTLKPKIGGRFPDAVPLSVNLPW